MLKLRLLLIAFTFSNLLSAQQIFTSKVIDITDGNTLNIIDMEFDTIQVVLKNIDCPEIDQEYGYEAKNFTSQMCLGKHVQIRAYGKDRFGNSIVTIELDEKTDLSFALVKAGLAWYCEKNKESSELEKTEKKVRAQKIGLWAGSQPMEPWVFRRQQTMVQAKVSY